MTAPEALSCDHCLRPVLTARTVDRKAALLILDAEPTTAGQYRINTDTAGILRCRKLTPTEHGRTGFGAKLYQIHTCPRADDYRRRYLKGPAA